MLVTKTEVDMHTGPAESVGGAKPDPEERPVLTSDTVVPQSKEGQHLKPGELVPGGPGEMNAGVPLKHVMVQSAAEAAEYLSAGQCGQCRHFNVRKGQDWLEKAKRGDGAERKVFTSIRNELAAICNLELMGASIYMDDRDEARMKELVSSELGEIGWCEAHSQIQKQEVLALPESTCLDGGYPNLFEANDAEITKQLEQVREQVLTTAAQVKD